MKSFRSQHEASCARCGELIPAGTDVLGSKDTGAWVLEHVQCSTKEPRYVILEVSGDIREKGKYGLYDNGSLSRRYKERRAAESVAEALNDVVEGTFHGRFGL